MGIRNPRILVPNRVNEIEPNISTTISRKKFSRSSWSSEFNWILVGQQNCKLNFKLPAPRHCIVLPLQECRRSRRFTAAAAAELTSLIKRPSPSKSSMPLPH